VTGAALGSAPRNPALVDVGVSSGLIELRSGRLLEVLSGSAHDVLARLAPVISELYSADRVAWAYAAFADCDRSVSASVLEEMVLVTPTAVYVAQRLPSEPDHALLTVGEWQMQVGAVVSAARAAAAGRERAR
jgi:hypothetical protein